jgi:membrane protease YdiL (CAAX protease family)
MTTFARARAGSAHQPRIGGVWVLLALPPVLFLLLVAAASIFYGAQGADPQAIEAHVQAAFPWLLLAAQFSLLLAVGLALRAGRLTASELGWQLPAGQTWPREAALGAAPGAVLGGLYVFVLTPALTWLQRTLGDYVPAGETLATLGSQLVPFFAANVLLAPLVEEMLYRGYAFALLRTRYRLPVVTVILTVAFGLLHWLGGWWYMLLTGVVAGGLLLGLRVWRGNLWAPLAAHLALNLVEFVLIALMFKR